MARFAARAASGELEVIVTGAGAPASARRYADEVRWTPFAASTASPRPIVTGFLKAIDAQRVLGAAAEPGGLLASVAGGDLALTLSTDGTALVLDIRRASPSPGPR